MIGRPLAMAVLFYTALYIAFFAVALFRGQLLAPGDAQIQSLAAFYSPPTLWTDLLLSGFPVAADPQVQSWYPPKLLFASVGAWNAFVLSAYVLASVGVYGYVHAVTGAPFAALVSGTVFGMSGFMMAHLGHTMIIHAAAWIPFIIWAIERLRQRLVGVWFVAGACFVAAGALAGHPQIFVYGLGLAAVYALVMGWELEARRWRYYGWCGGLMILGIAVSAIQLVPTTELTKVSLRTQLSFSDFVSYSLPIRQVTGLVFPYLFGGYTGSPHHPYFGEWNLTELTGYVGLLPLMIAVVGLVVGPRRMVTWFWIMVVLAALVLVLGDATPVGRLMYYVPVYSKFRVPARHFVEMTMAVSVLAGLGVASLRRFERGWPRAPVVIAAGGVAAVVTLAFVVSDPNVRTAAMSHGSQGISLIPWANPAVGTPLIVLAGAIAAVAVGSCHLRVTLTRGLFLSVLVIDLGSFGWFSEWRYGSPPGTILRPSPEVLGYARLLQRSHQRLLPIGGATNLPRLWGLPSASGYGPFVPQRMSDLLGVSSSGTVNAAWTTDANRALDILAVRYVVIDRDTLIPQPAEHKLGFAWTEQEPVLLGAGCGTPHPESVVFRASTPVRAATLGVVSALVCSAGVPDGAEIASVHVTDAGGHVTGAKLVAGRDTSEWAWDCVAQPMRHQRARVFESFRVNDDRGGCTGHAYLGVLNFGRSLDVTSVEVRWAGLAAEVQLQRLSLLDPATGTSRPLSAVASAIADGARWQRVGTIGRSVVFENLRVQPRAWLVQEAVRLPSREMLAAIKTSRLPDGRAFDPAHVALTDRRVSGLGAADNESGAVEVLGVSGTHLRLRKRAASTRLLVLSDLHYPGWVARIDGVTSRADPEGYPRILAPSNGRS